MTDRDAIKARITQELETLDFLIGTTPPDEDDEFFSFLLDERELLQNLLRYLNIEL